MNHFSELIIDRILVDGLVNPWFDKVSAIGFTFFMTGLLFCWFHQRINDAQIYYVLSLGLGVNGLVVLLFGRNPFPNPFIVVVFFVSLFFWMAALVSVFTVFVAQRGPDMGLSESAVLDADEGTPRFYIPVACTTIVLVLVWMGVSQPFVLLDKIIGIYAWALAVLMIVFVSVVAYALVPVTEVRETAFLSEPTKEIEDIFTINGAASTMEKMTVPMVSLAFWGVGVYFALNGFDVANDDFGGVAFLLIIGASIVLTEMNRARRSSLGEEGASDRSARNL